ncbi:MAG: polyprenyl synthetase family protein [Desulfamplus sp.]|nr:polyprenyl synthetase family protein [Desulfamplus sp.]
MTDIPRPDTDKASGISEPDSRLDTSFDLSGYLEAKREILESHLRKIIGRLDSTRELARAMEYSLMAGGKRLRPILAMASAEAVGGDFRLALPAACAIEMIHTYSLIHDDLPAMDNDDLRRGIPTCHRAFSQATAVLAGDALLTHAFSLLGDPWEIFNPSPEKSVLLELVAKISQAAGPLGMVEGQMMDMKAPSITKAWESSYPDENICPDGERLSILKELHALKTGRMISVSVEAGAISAGCSAKQMELLSLYSVNIGLAFQVTDDILNVEGDPAVMGKAAGSDALNRKLTFPALMGLGASREFARDLIQGAISSLDTFKGRADPLKAIAQYILRRNR